jgi:hypothetical protein
MGARVPESEGNYPDVLVFELKSETTRATEA